MSEENEKVTTVNDDGEKVEIKKMTPNDWARYHHFMGNPLEPDEMLLNDLITEPKPERPRRVVKRGFNRTK